MAGPLIPILIADDEHSNEAVWSRPLLFHAEIRIHHPILHQGGDFLAIVLLNISSLFRTIYQKRVLPKGQGGWPTQTGDKLKVGGSWAPLWHQAASRLVGVDYNGRRIATSGGAHLWRVHLRLPGTWKRRGAQWKCSKWKVGNNQFEVTRYIWIWKFRKGVSW